MKLFNERKRRTKLYLVGTPKEDGSFGECLAITSTHDDAEEYAIRYDVLMSHSEHFISWCDSHQRDINNLNNFYEYAYDLEIPAKSWIWEANYTKDELALFFRQATNYIPLGSSFDSDEHRKIFNNSLKKIRHKLEGAS